MFGFFDFWDYGGFGDPLYNLILTVVYAVLDLIFYFL